MAELSNITFLMRSFKDKNVDKQMEYNSDRLSYLTSKTFFKFVNILAGKLQVCFNTPQQV